MSLSESQLAALTYVRNHAIEKKISACQIIDHILNMSDMSAQQFGNAIANIRSHARVVVHFHPDRLDQNKRTVLQGMIEDNLYLNQFVSGISNGGLSASMNGAREHWEDAVFGHAYKGSELALRPNYGALDLRFFGEGPAPRFGSCYLVLKPSENLRCTFCYLDSSLNPIGKGVWDELDCLVAEIVTEAFVRESVLGKNPMSAEEFLNYLTSNIFNSTWLHLNNDLGRNLNHYIEAQIHGGIVLGQHVECVVCDPSFLGTETENSLEVLSGMYNIPVVWHRGFVCSLSDIPANYRGNFMPVIAKGIAENQTITASTIGKAAASFVNGVWTPEAQFASRDLLQDLKLLWHVLVKFGKPIR